MTALDYNMEMQKIKDLKLKIADLNEQIDKLEQENAKLKCSLELFKQFVNGDK